MDKWQVVFAENGRELKKCSYGLASPGSSAVSLPIPQAGNFVYLKVNNNLSIGRLVTQVAYNYEEQYILVTLDQPKQGG